VEYIRTLERCRKRLTNILSDATSCVIIGAGRAEREIELIVRAMPNLRRLTAVEPDAELALQLMDRVHVLLPTVETDVHQTTIEDWNGSFNSDVVFMFHMLYYVKSSYLPQLYSKFTNNGCRKPTYVVTLLEIDPSDSRSVFRSAGINLGPTPAELEKEMAAVGFAIPCREEFFYELDVSSDRGTDAFANIMCAIGGDRGVQHGAAVDAIRRVAGGRDKLRFGTVMCVFERHSGGHNGLLMSGA